MEANSTHWKRTAKPHRYDEATTANASENGDNIMFCEGDPLLSDRIQSIITPETRVLNLTFYAVRQFSRSETTTYCHVPVQKLALTLCKGKPFFV